MNQIKNLALLEGIFTEKQIDKMETEAALLKRHNSITFKIIKVTPKTVIISVRQERSSANNYYNEDQLIKLTRDTFGKFFPEKRILVNNAQTFKVSPVEVVTGQWIENKMQQYNVRLKNVCEDTGINYSYLSQIINSETEELSQIMKSFFWYYFQTKKQTTNENKNTQDYDHQHA